MNHIILISSSFSIPEDLLKVRDDGWLSGPRLLRHRHYFEQHINNSAHTCANHQTLIKVFGGKVFDLLFCSVRNRALTSTDGDAAFTTV